MAQPGDHGAGEARAIDAVRSSPAFTPSRVSRFESAAARIASRWAPEDGGVMARRGGPLDSLRFTDNLIVPYVEKAQASSAPMKKAG